MSSARALTRWIPRPPGRRSSIGLVVSTAGWCRGLNGPESGSTSWTLIRSEPAAIRISNPMCAFRVVLDHVGEQLLHDQLQNSTAALVDGCGPERLVEETENPVQLTDVASEFAARCPDSPRHGPSTPDLRRIRLSARRRDRHRAEAMRGDPDDRRILTQCSKESGRIANLRCQRTRARRHRGRHAHRHDRYLCETLDEARSRVGG